MMKWRRKLSWLKDLDLKKLTLFFQPQKVDNLKVGKEFVCYKNDRNDNKQLGFVLSDTLLTLGIKQELNRN